MGSSCSSGQGNKDKDNSSTRSEDSPSYQASDNKKEKEQDLSKRGGEKVGQQEKQGSLKSSQTKETASGGKPPAGCTECTPTKPSVSVVEVIPKETAPQVAKVKSPSPRKESKIPAVRQPSEKEKKIVVYVCAADSQDSKVEKSLLHSEIYPQLRQSLQKSNFELHLVDLHWSLQDKTPEPSELCLHELERQWERSYLVPVIFLNDRLGAPLLPKTIEMSDYESVVADEEQSPPSRPLDRWYILDTQAEPPCYRLLPPSTLLPALKSLELKEREKAMTDWRKEVERALGLMLSAWETDVRDTYLTTVVEQEVQRTLLMSPREVRGRCLWMYRACHSPGLNNNSGPSQLEQELARRLARLKSTIRNHLEEVNIFKVTPASGSDPGEQTDYLGQVSSHISKRLGVICEQIVEEHTAGMSWGVGGAEVGREARWHRRAALRAASLCSSLDRHTILSTVEAVHQQQPPGVSVFTGPEGSGKTGLLARLATSLKEEVIYRQVGTSRYSSTLVCLLLSVLRELGEMQGHVPHNIESYGPLLYTALEKRAAIRPTTLIIDGIDQFREFGLNVVTWLPRKLPPGAKLIVSLSDTSDLLVSRLKTHLKDTSAKFIQVPELTKPEATMMLSSSLLEYNHSLDSSIRDIVLTALTISTLPLYIKVLAWETSWCSEYNLSLEPQGGLREQLSDMLQQLEGMLGKEQVEKALSLLICSKWGLTDSELLDILSSDSTFHTTTTALPWAGAYLFWSKLTRLLGPFLEHGEAGEVRPSDPGLGRAARERYRSKIPWAATLLYRYFSGQLWEDGRKIKARMIGQPTKFGETYNVRKLEELPYVTFKAQGSAAKYTLDADWLFDKLCGSTVHQVLEDVYLEPESEDVAWLRRFLEQRASPLEADGRQLYSQLSLHRAPPPPTPLGSLLSGPPRIVSLIQTEVDEDEEAVESGSDEDIDYIGRLPHNHNFVVTISTEAGQISVWDVVRCRRVRRLSRVPQPTALHMIDDYKSVVLCGRELRVYDLNTGSLLTKLKGVMNQKMPYFGLHDSDHLVALSRNRMYVNLMNLTTGDLVTTFKAGEDRFLNSLLVSGDGRILVCGDETQKPMPLLVWNLSSRKLLYDLRIPHHDFVTRMSAITHNGAYVCCVAKEVDDEATPNYIVVYDLQSGTLFKKWKKGVDTTAVDISSTESSVISGHADRTIIVWDLITGNRRWIFRGHKGPVSYLRLSPSGSVCLSTGDQDPSIRLWDLATGKLVAVWTPDAMTRTGDLTDRHVVLSQVDKGLTTLYLAGPGHTIRERRTQFRLYIPKGLVQEKPLIKEEVIYGDADRMGEETESGDQ